MSAYQDFSDYELISLLKKGDEVAFSEIYSRYWEKMASYAIRLTKSEDEGADIVQEIFVSLWKRRDVVEIKGTVGAYLIKSTRNLSLKYIEKNITKHHFLDHLSEQTRALFSDVEEDLSFAELQEHVDQVISGLPSKMRRIYLLSRDEQLSHREIAQQLGIAEGTVKKQISNALKIISTAIKKSDLSSGALSVTLYFLLK